MNQSIRKSGSKRDRENQVKKAFSQRKTYLSSLQQNYEIEKIEHQELQKILQDLEKEIKESNIKNQILQSNIKRMEEDSMKEVRNKNIFRNKLSDLKDEYKQIKPAWEKKSLEIKSQIFKMKKLKNEATEEKEREDNAFQEALYRVLKDIENEEKEIGRINKDIEKYKSNIMEMDFIDDEGNQIIKKEAKQFKDFILKLKRSGSNNSGISKVVKC